MKYISIILPLLLLAGSCKETEPEKASEQPGLEINSRITLTEKAMKNAGILLGTAEIRMVSENLKVNGMVDVPPQSLVSISFPLGGYLKSTELLPGMKVRKGQAIAIMEDQAYVQLQQDYLQALSKLKFLNLDFDRQKELSDVEASSMKNFQQVSADLDMQKILVKSLSEKLLILGVQPKNLTLDKISRDVPILSPIDGFVKSVYVNIGKYVNPSDVLFEIVDPRDIHAALTVFEKDAMKVQPEQQVKIFAAGHGEKPYLAEVLLVSRDIDENHGATIHCHFHGDHRDLLPGMFVNGEIQIGEQSMPVIPEGAVVRHLGKSYIFRQINNLEFQMEEVSLGNVNEGLVAINGAGSDFASKKIVIKNAYALLGKLMNVGEE